MKTHIKVENATTAIAAAVAVSLAGWLIFRQQRHHHRLTKMSSEDAATAAAAVCQLSALC